MPPPPPVVVVIEDQPELGVVIREVLGAQGFDAIAVRDPAAALAELAERSVVFLVSDIPSKASGEADPLRSIVEAHPDLPVIVIRDERADDVPFFGPWRREGSRVLLRRPFRLDDLIAASRDIYEAATS